MALTVVSENRDNERHVSEPFERRGEPGVWSIEEIGQDGEIYQAIFIGPDAERRCREYHVFKYGSQ